MQRNVNEFTQLHSSNAVVILNNPFLPSPLNPESLLVPSSLPETSPSPESSLGDCDWDIAPTTRGRCRQPTPLTGVIVRHVRFCHPRRRLDISPDSFCLFLTRASLCSPRGKAGQTTPCLHVWSPGISSKLYSVDQSPTVRS